MNRIPMSALAATIRRGPAPRSRSRGLTLIEMMVAITISLLLLTIMVALFVGSTRSRREAELSSDAIESGRYAIDLLSRELSHAGFYGTLAGINVSGVTSQPCSVPAPGNLMTTWGDSLSLHVQGWNSAPGGFDPNPDCLVGRDAGTGPTSTDAVYIQRASTCYVGETDGAGNAICDPESPSNAYLQISECAPEYISMVTTTGKPYVVAAGGSAGFTLQTSACNGTLSVKRQLIRRIYFVDRNDSTLKSMDINLNGAQPPVTLVENIEQMQLEYAIATPASLGTAQTFTSTPAAADWPNVVGVRVSVLARSTDTTPSAARAADFRMGDYTCPDPSTDTSTCVHIPAALTNAKRRVYTSYIPFVTPKMRVEQ